MSKNKRNKIKVRRTWGIKPGTQIHAVDTKKYIRNQARKEWEDEFVDEILEDDQEHEEFE